MSSPVIDIYLVYEFLKRLVTPFDQTKAFKLGLIDATGKKLKKAQTPEERNAMGYFDRLVFNLKRLLGKIPGGQRQIASYAAALLLIREYQNPTELGDNPLMLEHQLFTEMHSLQLNEDAPVNATGSAVAGTGDSGVHWVKPPPNRKRMGKPIDGIRFIRRKRYELIKRIKQGQ